MDSLYTKTELLIGEQSAEKLKNSKVLICGLGGVGSYAVEALCRAGVGLIGLLDHDKYSVSNLNRQLYATIESVSKSKIETAKNRILSINPNCKVEDYDLFYLPETADNINLDDFDYVIDCIDTITAKIELITRAKDLNVKIISCMGTGNKLYTNFEVADISQTSVCPLAKVMRKELKNRNIKDLKVVFSKEVAKKTSVDENGRHIPASISYVPAVAGLTLAGEVVRDLIGL